LEDKTESLHANSAGNFDASGNFVQTTTTAQTGDKAGWLELQSAFAQRFFLVSNIRYDAAMAVKVTERLWQIGDIVDVLEAWETAAL
jgi:hypothetical protein